MPQNQLPRPWGEEQDGPATISRSCFWGTAFLLMGNLARFILRKIYFRVLPTLIILFLRLM